MRSQLTDANISNIDGNNWTAQYVYKKNGDMYSRTIQSNTETFSYTGHQMTDADGNSLSWDENGNMKELPDDSVTTELIYNWDNKLRTGTKGGDSINIRYDPSGNRIWKQSTVSAQTTTRKYILDIVGNLPTILLELEEVNPGEYSVVKTYIYANSQIIAQHDGEYNASRYFYLHDRLGSVRQIIDTSGNVKNRYTYRPFGESYDDEGEVEETITNPFKFTGQYFDSEIDEYYLRARQGACPEQSRGNPHIGRFTSRDPVFGKFREPLTLHTYLYCLNDPVNMVDPEGRFAYNLVSSILTGSALYAHGINLATYAVSSGNWKFFGLAESTFKFMPVGMAVATVSPIRFFSPGWLTGLGMGAGIEWTTKITGMGPLESGAMDYWSYLLYASYMFSERADLEIWPWDMQDFLEWKD